MAQLSDRRAVLAAALGFARLHPRADMPELEPLRRWRGGWAGIGAIAAGMARQGYDVRLTKYADQGWLRARANRLIAMSGSSVGIVREAPGVLVGLAKANVTHDLVLAAKAFALQVLPATPEHALLRSLEIATDHF